MLRVSGVRRYHDGYRLVAMQLLCSIVVMTFFLSGCPVNGPIMAPPDASFEGKPATGNPPLKVQFTDTSKPGTAKIVSWFWEFGDGAVSSERNPSHLYYETGAYTVSLTVTTVVSPASKANR
jgi:PKD repeat protein